MYNVHCMHMYIHVHVHLGSYSGRQKNVSIHRSVERKQIKRSTVRKRLQ